MTPEDVIANKRRPYSGAEYRQRLREGREVYIDGERVKNVTAHPAFRNSVRSLSRLYDSLHDPQRRDLLTMPTDTGSGGYTFRYFRSQRDYDETGWRDATWRKTIGPETARCGTRCFTEPNGRC
jgi:4-hydroxyphenylacetate 3-monooxygenase